MTKMRKMRKIYWSLIISFFAFLFPFLVLAQGARLFFEPAEISAEKGEVITVSVMADSAGHNVSGADIVLDFDESKLSLQSAANNSCPSFNRAPQESGRMSCYWLSNPVSGVFTVATLTFEVLEKTEANIGFNFSPGNTSLTNLAELSGDGRPVPILEAVTPLVVNRGIVFAADGDGGGDDLWQGSRKSAWDVLADLNTFIFILAMSGTVLMILLAAYYYITSAGDPTKIDKAKQTLFYAIIGSFLALLAKIIPEVIKVMLRPFGT